MYISIYERVLLEFKKSLSLKLEKNTTIPWGLLMGVMLTLALFALVTLALVALTLFPRHS